MSHFQDRLDLFKIKSFRNYILSCSLAMFGNGLTYVAMTWSLVKNQNQVAAVAVLMTCFWLPNILLGPFAGVLVDKYRRKTLLLFCNFSRAIFLFMFWLVTSAQPGDYAIYCLALFCGSLLSLYIPAAMTLVREIVEEDKLLYANATVDMAYELGAVAGMGASGLIMGMTSIHFTFLINAFCYITATLAMMFVHTQVSCQEKRPDKSIFKDLYSGMKYLSCKSDLLFIYGIQMLFFVSYMTAPILLAPYAHDVLHTSAGEFGYIEAAMSIGAVLGGILTPYFCEKYGFMKVMLFETLLSCISFYGFSHNLYIAYAIFWYMFIGFCFSAWPMLITVAQEKTDFVFQGRVQSLFNSFSGIFILIFYLLLGFAGDTFQIEDLYWVEVILMVLSMTLLLFGKTSKKP